MDLARLLGAQGYNLLLGRGYGPSYGEKDGAEGANGAVVRGVARLIVSGPHTLDELAGLCPDRGRVDGSSPDVGMTKNRGDGRKGNAGGDRGDSEAVAESFGASLRSTDAGLAHEGGDVPECGRAGEGP